MNAGRGIGDPEEISLAEYNHIISLQVFAIVKSLKIMVKVGSSTM